MYKPFSYEDNDTEHLDSTQDFVCGRGRSQCQNELHRARWKKRVISSDRRPSACVEKSKMKRYRFYANQNIDTVWTITMYIFRAEKNDD